MGSPTGSVEGSPMLFSILPRNPRRGTLKRPLHRGERAAADKLSRPRGASEAHIHTNRKPDPSRVRKRQGRPCSHHRSPGRGASHHRHRGQARCYQNGRGAGKDVQGLPGRNGRICNRVRAPLPYSHPNTQQRRSSQLVARQYRLLYDSTWSSSQSSPNEKDCCARNGDIGPPYSCRCCSES